LRPIILIGFMGVGKTSLGKKLAKKLNWQFLDTDKWIEKKTGLSIPAIFEQKGEVYFRELERNCIDESRVLQNTVISVGGGLPCFGDAMSVLNSFGTTIYLKLEPQEIARRLSESKIERPLINGLKENELEKYVEKKLLEREKHYSKAKYTLRPDREFIENYLKIIE
jgi:shikimate kinase